jgi:long-chain fatty acid transport protein
MNIKHVVVRSTGLAAAIGLTASAAVAGGFAVREQSALGQGASFAGAGASTALSAMFMNSAAVTSLDGLNVDSNLSAILPEGVLTATTNSTRLGKGFNESTDIGRNAYVPAAYANYQFKNYDPRMYIGLGVNSAFGLRTEPDKQWAGSEVGTATQLFTTNFNPTIGYKLSDKLSVGAGVAFEYAKATFKFATGSPTGPNSFVTGDDMAVGATAGLMYTPTPATRIGLGWRSQITHELDGRQGTNGNVISGATLVQLGKVPAGAPAGVADAAAAGINAQLNAGVATRVELRLPDIVNLSLTQALSSNTRLLATAEWTNWSRFGGFSAVTTGSGVSLLPSGLPGAVSAGTKLGTVSAPWSDGWFFSTGLEYDVSSKLTVRAGGAYEISPIKNATDRVIGIPDADRIWASAGLSYNISPTTTVDFGYSHVFVDSAQVDRTNLTQTVRLVGNLDASVDIFSLGVRMKLGE